MPRLFLHFLLTSLLLSACDAHDYWIIPDDISVNSQTQTLSASSEMLSQDLFVRYQLDYELHNDSFENATETVVSATSYVNNIERITGQKVWHLDPGKTAQGILTTSQLQLGNAISITLSCCRASRCSSRETLCPTSETLPEISEIANFCYTACADTSACTKQCPAETACAEFCQRNANVDQCRIENCAVSKNLATCAAFCDNNEECLKLCQPAQECTQTCIQNRAGCFNNCLAIWNQCTDEVYLPNTSNIPCSLCGGTGLCTANFDISEDDVKVIKNDNDQTFTCALDCDTFPTPCVTGCEDLYSQDNEKMDCMAACLQQHVFWCNDYTLPLDYVMSKFQQPCCFENFCQNTLSGVIKTYNVECFNDTSCKSGSFCNDEGICESNAAASCTFSRNPHPRNAIPWFIMLAIIFARFTFRKSHGA